MTSHADDRRVPCPGVELFLDSRGDLYVLPIRDREQLRIAAPWGRLVAQQLAGELPEQSPIEMHTQLDEIMDWLEEATYLRRASSVESDDTARWSRQVQWFAQETGDGPSHQRRLARSRVMVLGVGGLGGTIADLLCRAGVGSLTIVDHDVVELVNLPRQALYLRDDVGRRKVDVARERLLAAAADDASVTAVHEVITGPDDVRRLIEAHEPELIVCAVDRPPVSVKSWVEDAAASANVAVMHGGHRPPYVYAGPFFVPGSSSCYECFASGRVEPGAEDLEAELHVARDAECLQLPAVGWGDAAAASLIVGQCVNWLAGIADPALFGREIELDLRTLEMSFIDPAHAIRCARCTGTSLDLAA